MKKWIFAALAFAALLTGEVRADSLLGSKCTGPNCNHKAQPYGSYGRTLPVYMAAPWYLYWPYDAHFMTPAPVYGAYYAPPMMGNYPVQPYFPIPAYTPPQQPPIQNPTIGQ